VLIKIRNNLVFINQKEIFKTVKIRKEKQIGRIKEYEEKTKSKEHESFVWQK
jgi:hypothetical protein